jgi:5-(carboxyamino)imidazole ribonucleotide synthase
MIPPGSTIGIVGGGQLGRMLSMAAAKNSTVSTPT